MRFSANLVPVHPKCRSSERFAEAAHAGFPRGRVRHSRPTTARRARSPRRAQASASSSAVLLSAPPGDCAAGDRRPRDRCPRPRAQSSPRSVVNGAALCAGRSTVPRLRVVARRRCRPTPAAEGARCGSRTYLHAQPASTPARRPRRTGATDPDRAAQTRATCPGYLLDDAGRRARDPRRSSARRTCAVPRWTCIAHCSSSKATSPPASASWLPHDRPRPDRRRAGAATSPIPGETQLRALSLTPARAS